MTRSKDQDVSLLSGPSRPNRAILFELKFKKVCDERGTADISTEMFAALTLEEVVSYIRRRQPNLEIVEVKVSGRVQVLSSSEHL